jgi:ABC-type transport system involved in multi-copper enzyme maturation permease subunit
MLMVVCSVMAAAGSYLVRSLQQPTGASRLVFILFTLVAPVVLLVVVSLLRQAARWWQRRGRN